MPKSFLQIHSKAIGKTLLALLCGIFFINISIIVIYLIVGLNCYLSEPGEDIPSQFVTFEYFFQGLGYLSILMIIAFCAVLLYNYTLGRIQKTPIAQPTSPLQNLTKEQEQRIIDTLKTFAQPLPGKSKLNRARTTQFLRALTELGYIDANLDGKIIMPWVEYVTGYTDGEPGHFNDQYRKASKLDSNVRQYMEEITQHLNA